MSRLTFKRNPVKALSRDPVKALSRDPVKALSRRRRHPLAPYLLLLAALGLTGGLYTALVPSPHADAAPGISTASVDEGRALFLKNCSSCHGINAEGSSDGPSLVGVGAASVDFQVGTGRMPAAGSDVGQVPAKRVQFTEKQIAAFASYVASLAPGPAVAASADATFSPEDAAEGGEIFRTNCAMCHNFAGKGGALTRGKFAPPLDGVTPERILGAMSSGPQSMPVFSDTTMLPESKRKIVAFLKTTGSETSPGGASLGKIGPFSEGLVGWLVGMGALIGCAIWLGAKAR